jgi:hypothetical protein
VEVNNFKQLPEKCLLKASQKIIRKFLTPNAVYELSVSSSKIKVLLENVSNGIITTLLFQEISFEVEWSIDSHLKTFRDFIIIPLAIEPRRKSFKIFEFKSKRFGSIAGIDSLNNKMEHLKRRFSDQQDSVPTSILEMNKKL